MRKEHLAPDGPRDLPREYAFAVFSAEEIREEMRRLKKALETAPGIAPDDFTNEEWRGLIAGLRLHLGPAEPRNDSLREWAHGATDRERLALAYQVRRALSALAYAPGIYGSDYDPTTIVLLPVSYAQRIELLLGTGVLPVAWIRRLDLLKF
ncbi:MAG: hypothetical protein HZA69_01240 [Gammaproteobacteria bacterium]|nr:hypothetical protein [Gammaproteobacteria bacterium]